MPDLTHLRVCFVAGTLGQGGAERQLYYTLRTLKQHGAAVRLLSLTCGEFWEDRIASLGIPIVWVGSSGSRAVRLRRIIAELRHDPPDVVQSQHFYTNLYVALAARAVGIPGIGALRNDGISEVHARSGLLGQLSLRVPRLVAANSRTAIEYAVTLGMPRPRLHFLPNVVDTALFDCAPRRESQTVTLLTVGRFVQQKRFDRFVRVLDQVRRCGHRIRAILVGDGPQREQVAQQAAALGLDSIVEFHGSEREVATMYRRADMLVLTSDWEGTPNVVLEAMAAALPVVVTAVGGVPDLVHHGHTGLLAAPGDEDALARSVLELVSDPEKRTRLGRNAREFVETHHALSRLARELPELYRVAFSSSG